MKDPKDILTLKGRRITNARVKILDILMKNKTPLSVQDIKSKISDSRINTSTIYRNLLELEKSGIVSEVNIGREMSFFEFLDEHNHHHHHIVCTGCKKIEEVEICDIEKYTDKVIESSKDFSGFFEHKLEFFGTCKKCATK